MKMQAIYKVSAVDMDGVCSCCDESFDHREFYDTGDGEGASKAMLSARRLVRRLHPGYKVFVERETAGSIPSIQVDTVLELSGERLKPHEDDRSGNRYYDLQDYGPTRYEENPSADDLIELRKRAALILVERRRWSARREREKREREARLASYARYPSGINLPH